MNQAYIQLTISIATVILAIYASIRLNRENYAKDRERIAKLESAELSMRKVLDQLLTNVSGELKEIGSNYVKIHDQIFTTNHFVQRSEFEMLLQQITTIQTQLSEIRNLILKK